MESLLKRRRYLFEAEDDETSDANTEEPADGNGEAETDNDSSGDNGEEEETQSENDDEDYTIDADPDEEQSDDETGDDEEDTSDDTTMDDSSSDDTPSEESPMDQEMFDSLSDDEKERKIYVLKKQYVDMYSNCSMLIEKFNQISDEDDENVNPVIKRVLKIIYDLKEYISYYLLNTFDHKSYIENDITFGRYLSILNGIKLIVQELQKSQEDENK